jgi:hypothetical protein
MPGTTPLATRPDQAAKRRDDADGHLEIFTLRRFAAALTLAAILAACAAAIHRITVGSPQALGWNPYGYSEWLINYAAGFTRRGIVGEILHHAAAGGPILPAVNAIVYCSYLAVEACLILLFVLSRRGGMALAILLPLVPGGAISMAVNGEFFYRKELLATAMFAVLCVLYRIASLISLKPLRRILLSSVIAIAWLSLPIATLNHESYVFLNGIAVCALIYAAASDLGLARPSRLAASYFGIGIAGFFAMALFHGSPRIAAGVWQSLSAFDQSQIAATGVINKTSGGAIGAIGWSVLDVLKLDFGVLTSGMVWYWFFALGVAAAFSVSMFFVDDPVPAAQPSLQPSDRMGFFLLLTLFSLPLFLLGWDWGRWLAAITMLAVLSGLTLNVETTRAVVPQPLRVPFRSLDRLEFGARRSRRLVGLAALAVVGLTFRIPECCIEGSGLATGTFYRSLLSGALSGP